MAFLENHSAGSNGPQTQFLPNPSAVPTTDLIQNADVGAEYMAITAAMQSVRLPLELTLPAEAGSKEGMKEDN